MLFEAGALAKAVDTARVCPYLIDMKKSDVPSGPLTTFQAMEATKDETFQMLKSINAAMGESALDAALLSDAFTQYWGSLAAVLSGVPAVEQPEEPSRTEDDKIDEILDTVRALSRQRLLPNFVPPPPGSLEEAIERQLANSTTEIYAETPLPASDQLSEIFKQHLLDQAREKPKK